MEGAACGYATHALHSPAMQGSGCCLRIRDARAAQCAKRCRSRIPKCSPECSEDSRAGQDLDYLVMETPMPSEMQTPRPTTSTILARRKASAKYRERQLSSSTNEELLRKKARERMASGHLRRRAAVKKDQTLAEESRRRVQEYNKSIVSSGLRSLPLGGRFSIMHLWNGSGRRLRPPVEGAYMNTRRKRRKRTCGTGDRKFARGLSMKPTGCARRQSPHGSGI
ncbi:hypothetical protein GGX14DRAFT_393880 [Mycena pura]|uniref:Uncharacterized protein n=1 Tax=Mycena pura TaxID=153505 RepID=A0AAD6YCY6_9AGAR|nr:hypothetical protein GGX14DRAFT_393880 [Mycena pura]